MTLGVERRLGVRVDRSRWRTVFTVRDVVDALQETLQRERSDQSPLPRQSVWQRLIGHFRAPKQS